MKITVVGRQMTVPDDLKVLAEKKLAKLDRYFSKEESAKLTFSRKRNRENIEITIMASNTIFRCETSDETFRNALDKAVDTIDRQIRKNKTRLEKRLGKNAFELSRAEDELSEPSEKIVRTKSFKLTPMTVEEAILQMNLLGHSFYMFEDAENGLVCVVYSRKDGDYGLIIPDKD
jgi:putative sigma-54 modulation protein